MTALIPLVVLGVVAGVGIAWRTRRERAARQAPRNDLLRAGSDPEATPEGASLRAQGKAAWMRPSGF